jgi:hypothetical protein
MATLNIQTFQGNVESFLFQAFYTTPKILLSVQHSGSTERKDVMSFWAEDVTEIHFRVCVREMVSFSGIHDNLYLVSILFSLFSKHHINIRWFCLLSMRCPAYLSLVYNPIYTYSIDNDHVFSVATTIFHHFKLLNVVILSRLSRTQIT